MAQEDTAHRYLPLSFVDLKKECQKRGLDSGGTKDNLIKRLVIQDSGNGPKRSPSSPSLNEVEKPDRVDPKSARSVALSPRTRAVEIDSQMTKPTASRSPDITAARRRSTDKEKMSRSKTASAIVREGREERRDEDKEKKEKTSSSKAADRDRKTPPLSPKKSSIIEPRKQRDSGDDKDNEKDKERSSRGESDRESKEHRDRDRERMLSPVKERGSRTSPKEVREVREKKEKKVPRESPRGHIPDRPASPNLAVNPAFSPPPHIPVSVSTTGPRPQTVHFTSPRSTGMPSSNSMNSLSSQASPAPTPLINVSQPIPPLPTPTPAAPPQYSPRTAPDLGASIHALAKGPSVPPMNAAKVTSPTPPMSPLRTNRTYLTQEIVYLSCAYSASTLPFFFFSHVAHLCLISLTGQGLKDEDAFRVAQEMLSETCKTRELLLGGNAISSHGA